MYVCFPEVWYSLADSEKGTIQKIVIITRLASYGSMVDPPHGTPTTLLNYWIYYILSVDSAVQHA